MRIMNLNKLMVWTMLVTIFMVSLFSNTVNAASSFKDVAAYHWAKSSIDWGVKNNIITGYTDKTFRPNNNVNEAEFLAMYIRAFDTASVEGTVKHWADPVYFYASAKNWPILGTNSTDARIQKITRGHVAQIIAASQGLNISELSSVQFLLNEGYSSGKTDATVDGYKPNDYITRAETIVFIKRLKDAGIQKLGTRPTAPGEEIVEEPKVEITKQIEKITNKIDSTITSNSVYAGLSTKA